MNFREKHAISILELKRLIGKDEYDKKTVSEWVVWLSNLEIFADCIVEEIYGSKYKSDIENTEQTQDNGRQI